MVSSIAVLEVLKRRKEEEREHYQWNMDIIGCKEITAEVELLSAAVEFFKSCGITKRGRD